jgi:hypothetical protein
MMNDRNKYVLRFHIAQITRTIKHTIQLRPEETPDKFRNTKGKLTIVYMLLCYEILLRPEILHGRAQALERKSLRRDRSTRRHIYYHVSELVLGSSSFQVDTQRILLDLLSLNKNKTCSAQPN